MTDHPNFSQVLKAFSPQLQGAKTEPLPGGLIHGSWKVKAESGEQFVLQQMNTRVFEDPEAVMSNIVQVTEHLRGKGVRTLDYVGLDNAPGKQLLEDEEGQVWRLGRWVEKTRPAGTLETLEQVEKAGRIYGQFHRSLMDFPADNLKEVISGFHDTPSRWAALLQAAHEDPVGRAHGVQDELAWLMERGDLAHGLLRLELPVRVVHNDAKWDNVLLDQATGQPCCVVDLDTVMPGTLLHDFGDMVRTMCCTADEEETDLDQVGIDVERVEALAKGWLAEVGEMLEPAESQNLLPGALVIVFEQAVRFLTDYLRGDEYYSVSHEEHNLDRARNQVVLLDEMLEAGPGFMWACPSGYIVDI
jgi:hypothetical protein